MGGGKSAPLANPISTDIVSRLDGGWKTQYIKIGFNTADWSFGAEEPSRLLR